jgi:hypothetical protein
VAVAIIEFPVVPGMMLGLGASQSGNGANCIICQQLLPSLRVHRRAMLLRLLLIMPVPDDGSIPTLSSTNRGPYFTRAGADLNNSQLTLDASLLQSLTIILRANAAVEYRVFLRKATGTEPGYTPVVLNRQEPAVPHQFSLTRIVLPVPGTINLLQG